MVSRRQSSSTVKFQRSRKFSVSDINDCFVNGEQHTEMRDCPHHGPYIAMDRRKECIACIRIKMNEDTGLTEMYTENNVNETCEIQTVISAPTGQTRTKRPSKRRKSKFHPPATNTEPSHPENFGETTASGDSSVKHTLDGNGDNSTMTPSATLGPGSKIHHRGRRFRVVNKDQIQAKNKADLTPNIVNEYDMNDDSKETSAPRRADGTLLGTPYWMKPKIPQPPTIDVISPSPTLSLLSKQGIDPPKVNPWMAYSPLSLSPKQCSPRRLAQDMWQLASPGSSSPTTLSPSLSPARSLSELSARSHSSSGSASSPLPPLRGTPVLRRKNQLPPLHHHIASRLTSSNSETEGNEDRSPPAHMADTHRSLIETNTDIGQVNYGNQVTTMTSEEHSDTPEKPRRKRPSFRASRRNSLKNKISLSGQAPEILSSVTNLGSSNISSKNMGCTFQGSALKASAPSSKSGSSSSGSTVRSCKIGEGTKRSPAPTGSDMSYSSCSTVGSGSIEASPPTPERLVQEKIDGATVLHLPNIARKNSVIGKNGNSASAESNAILQEASDLLRRFSMAGSMRNRRVSQLADSNNSGSATPGGGVSNYLSRRRMGSCVENDPIMQLWMSKASKRSTP